MALTLRILEIILPVLAILLLGYVLGRRWRPDMTVVNRFNLDLFAPMLILAYLSDKRFDLVSLWPLAVAAVVIALGSGLLAWPVARLAGVSPRTFLPPMMFNNCGNMGLPLALFAFGPFGMAGMVVLFSVSTLVQFTIGVYIVHKHAELKHLYRSPMVWAIVLGAALGLSGTRLPDGLHTPIKLIGDCTVPVMLLSLGVRMTQVHARDLKVSLLGAIVCPLSGLLAAWPLLYLLPMESAEMRGLIILFAALPPAVLTFLVADYYRQEPARVASIVLIGHLASIVFIPLALLLALQ